MIMIEEFDLIVLEQAIGLLMFDIDDQQRIALAELMQFYISGCVDRARS